MSKVQEDIKLMKEYLSGDRSNIVCCSTSFKNANKIITITNEKLALCYERNLCDKKILSVTSSGDQILHSVLAGATNITGFDINRFCKYYSALKIAMVKRYNYSEFREKIKDLIIAISSAKFSDRSRSVFIQIFNEVFIYLTDDEINFWSSYFEFKNEDKCISSIGTLELDIFDNAYSYHKNYYMIKDNLRNCMINYLDKDIISVIDGVTYDYINISNILDYAGDKKVEILTNLHKGLNEDGFIGGYAFFSFAHVNRLKNNPEITKLFDIETREYEENDKSAKIYKFIRR